MAAQLAEDVLHAINEHFNALGVKATHIPGWEHAFGDAIISFSDFRQGLEYLEFEISDEDFSAVTSQLDKDGSGFLSLKALEMELAGVWKRLALRQHDILEDMKQSLASEAVPIPKPECEEQGSRRIVHAPLMQSGEMLLAEIQNVFSKRKAKMLDVHRILDPGCGAVTAKELRKGLEQLAIVYSDDDFASMWEACSGNGSISMSLKEFYKALKLAHKKSRQLHIKEFSVLSERRDWSSRSVQLESLSGYSMGSSIGSTCTSNWVSASSGPISAVTTARLGCGNIQDSSVSRPRLLDNMPASLCSPPTLEQCPSPAHRHRFRQPLFRGRFCQEPCELAPQLLHSYVRCSTAVHALMQPELKERTRKFPTAPWTKSSVAEVVFCRDKHEHL